MDHQGFLSWHAMFWVTTYVKYLCRTSAFLQSLDLQDFDLLTAIVANCLLSGLINLLFDGQNVKDTG